MRVFSSFRHFLGTGLGGIYEDLGFNLLRNNRGRCQRGCSTFIPKASLAKLPLNLTESEPMLL